LAAPIAKNSNSAANNALSAYASAITVRDHITGENANANPAQIPAAFALRSEHLARSAVRTTANAVSPAAPAAASAENKLCRQAEFRSFNLARGS
jgi:hypothetical protein